MFHFCDIQISPDTKVADLVLENPYLALMLEHFGIAFPLKEKTVVKLCTENGINVDLFISLASLFSGTSKEFTNNLVFEDIPVILQYLKNDHQYFTDEKYPQILALIREMKSSSNQEEIVLVEKFFNEYFAEVVEHLKYENEIVFPYVTRLYKALHEKNAAYADNGYSVEEYREHHDNIEEKLSDLKNLLIKYLPAKDDQSSRRRLLTHLFELESDLTIHSKIEDHVLVPLVAQMEKHVKGKSQ
ncbi:MAG: hemerythrin domain-containing protein [Bacteroidales bacterium]|nr:hemerythrin domain-containing protein [Bacteroidales bacterium]